MLNVMINVSGTHIVYGLIGEMLSKHEIVATDKKYKFATLRNCSYKPLGRNVTTLYFDVDIELLLNFNGAFVSRSELIENTRDIGFSCSFLNIDVARSRTEGDFVKDLFLFLQLRIRRRRRDRRSRFQRICRVDIRRRLRRFISRFLYITAAHS
jgi:hypothetical protein